MARHELREILHRIDGRGYQAYRELEGHFALGALELYVDHVQGDPFAPPSRLRLRLPRGPDLPPELSAGRTRRIALADHLARRLRDAIRRERPARRGSGRSGSVLVDSGAQEVLERSAVVVDDAWVEARLQVGLPAAGRRVLGRVAEELLCGVLPRLAERALSGAELDAPAARRFVECVENQEHVRSRLGGLGLVAFVGDGAILPRESGASERPLTGPQLVAFRAPESLRVEIPVPNPDPDRDGPADRWVGMGIGRGVTLIVGGGYHGKSTLLRALARGVYPHVPGDGRERVVSAPGLVKVRAEDGRRVEQVDISAFIGELPGGRRTDAFSSDDASGSTSQAAAIVEAIEAGASGLLLDEDTSATNFMVRDARMRALVEKRHEPITPFLERVRELSDRLGVSTILVMGGVGDYFEVADRVLMMREFRPVDVSAEARRIAASGPPHLAEATGPLGPVVGRIPLAESFEPSRGRHDVRIDARNLDSIRFGSESIDLRGVEQLVDVSQTRAVGMALHLAAERWMDGRTPLAELLDRLDAFLDAHGLDELEPRHRPGRHPGNLARPRRFEVAAAINRLRSVRMKQVGAGR